MFFQAVASKWQSHRQLLVLSVYFSWDALKRYTSGIMMQRYNSMLSSSIILIFPSELIIHTDNLMIFLGDSRLVETVYVLFSYLIWKMATNINIHYPECSRHPTLVLAGKSGEFPFLTNTNDNSWKWQARESNAGLQCGCFELCSGVAAFWNALLCSPSSRQELPQVLWGEWSCAAAAPGLCMWPQQMFLLLGQWELSEPTFLFLVTNYRVETAEAAFFFLWNTNDFILPWPHMPHLFVSLWF